MSGETPSSRKTVIVGFDGMDWRYVDRFSGVLPHLEELRKRGVTADLRSTHPPWTGSAWPSMYTGTTPDHHGIYDFFTYSDRYPDSANAVTKADVKVPALWDYLSDRGIPSLVMNVPVTHPAESIEGTLLPGYLAPENEPGYPEGIREDISNATGDQYRIYSEHETASDTERKINGYVDLVERRGTAAGYLLESTSWELAIVQFQKTDAVFHNSSREADFKRVYEAADQALGRILESCGEETNVIVCSDHGMGPTNGYQVHINQILEDHGYLTSKKSVDGPGEFKPVETDETNGGRATNVITENLTKTASAVGLSPGRVYRIADRIGVADTLVQAAPNWIMDSTARGVDWERSMAYCRTQSEQGIRINLRGRDPSGIVDPEEYETVRTDIINRLSELRTPDGKPAFEFVKRREAVYDGPYAEDACDIVFLPNEMNHVIWTKLHGPWFHPLTSYDHKRNGVFIADGPAIDTTATIDQLSLADVAPIAMTVLGQPVPERMTGIVPDGLVTRTRSRTRYETATDDHSAYEQDQETVRDRLSDLGYL